MPSNSHADKIGAGQQILDDLLLLPAARDAFRRPSYPLGRPDPAAAGLLCPRTG